MKRSKKLKLTHTAKIIFSILVIGIVLCSLTFVHSNKKIEGERNEIVEEKNYTLKIDYPKIDNKKIDEKVANYIKEKKEEFQVGS